MNWARKTGRKPISDCNKAEFLPNWITRPPLNFKFQTETFSSWTFIGFINLIRHIKKNNVVCEALHLLYCVIIWSWFRAYILFISFLQWIQNTKHDALVGILTFLIDYPIWIHFVFHFQFSDISAINKMHFKNDILIMMWVDQFVESGIIIIHCCICSTIIG